MPGIARRNGRRDSAPPILGKTFARLTVIASAGVSGVGKTLWRCRCVCGNEVVVPRGGLTSGNTRSCGCLKSDVIRARSTTHGHKSRSNAAPEYAVWVMMIQRCTNPEARGYDRYGGRGITVCDRWRSSYAGFIEDMGRRPSDGRSIERVDNDGNYEPTNCVWATREEQANNTRTNVLVEYEGETMTIAELSRRTGVPPGPLAWRIHNKWTVSEAVSIPVETGGRPKSAVGQTTSCLTKETNEHRVGPNLWVFDDALEAIAGPPPTRAPAGIVTEGPPSPATPAHTCKWCGRR